MLSFLFTAVNRAESFPARAAAQKALALDESLPKRMLRLGSLPLESRCSRAIHEYERAIQLKPNYATAHHWFGLALATLRPFDRAIAEGKRAVELDPLSVVINADLGITYTSRAVTMKRRAVSQDAGHRSVFLRPLQPRCGAAAQGPTDRRDCRNFKKPELNNDHSFTALLGPAYARGRDKRTRRNKFSTIWSTAKPRRR